MSAEMDKKRFGFAATARTMGYALGIIVRHQPLDLVFLLGAGLCKGLMPFIAVLLPKLVLEELSGAKDPARLVMLVLAAAGAVLGVQGWTLYRATQPELPAAQLYETLSVRPGFTTCDAIPQTYIDAVIAVEDSRFELHHGVDPVAIVRALWTDLRTR